MNILMIDNHDSFTYNLVHYIEAGSFGANVTVVQPGSLSDGIMEEKHIGGIVISPGPSHPADRPEVIDFVRKYWHSVPVLGICLGQQMLWHMSGGSVERGVRPVHGHAFDIHHDGGWLFEGLPDEFKATRYHSLVCANPVPSEFEVCAWASDGTLMGIRHREYKVAGLQYHPEAILSEHGEEQLDSFIRTVWEGDLNAGSRKIQEG